jgi:bifunctional UDP-N-acetylglucosamine pyrophosphorylase/glucosamine-1-phosphate N-acetyltransferase
MKSDLPKVLHRVMGRPVITHVLNAARYLSLSRLIVVTGHRADLVEAEIAPFGCSPVRQEDPRGTGHAVQTAMPALEGHEGPVVILPGDVPLISPQTLIDLLDAHQVMGAPMSVLTVRVEDPAFYGRIVRDGQGWVERIVEAGDASRDELAIDEINSGIYVADCAALRESVFDLKPDNVQKEYYLTDVVAGLRAKGHPVAGIEGPDPLEVQGVNDRRELALAQTVLRRRINDSWLLFGVTMEDPATAHIESGVKLAKDVTLAPGVILSGATKIGQGASVGPYTRLRDVTVDPGAVLGGHLDLADVRVPKDGISTPLSRGPKAPPKGAAARAKAR